MNLRHLSYFVALAREKHFARAAASCHVAQPSLSAAIRQLEEELGVPLVERTNQRFKNLTAEGERVLSWAHRVLADRVALTQELDRMRVGLSGRLRLGVIPAAMPVVSLITTPFSDSHPLVSVAIRSHTSIEIQRGLDEFEIDLGFTYLDNEPLGNVRTLPLYRERYVLLTPDGGPLDGRASVTWREAAELPLCLLTPDMQNRRIVNRNFQAAGVEPRAVIETDDMTALCAHVRFGQWSSIFSHPFVALFGGLRHLRAIPLIEPAASQSVGLVATSRDPLSPIASAVLDAAETLDIAARLDALMQEAEIGA